MSPVLLYHLRVAVLPPVKAEIKQFGRIGPAIEIHHLVD